MVEARGELWKLDMNRSFRALRVDVNRFQRALRPGKDSDWSRKALRPRPGDETAGQGELPRQHHSRWFQAAPQQTKNIMAATGEDLNGNAECDTTLYKVCTNSQLSFGTRNDKEEATVLDGTSTTWITTHATQKRLSTERLKREPPDKHFAASVSTDKAMRCPASSHRAGMPQWWRQR